MSRDHIVRQSKSFGVSEREMNIHNLL